MSPEVFAAECNATVDRALPQVRQMLGAAPADGVLGVVALSLYEQFNAGQLAPLAAAALVRLVEEQDAHATARDNFEVFADDATARLAELRDAP
jgi:lysozyme family protein